MFGDEANTDSMTEFNVMQQIEEAPKTTRMRDAASNIHSMAWHDFGLKQPINSFVWLIGEVLVW